MFYMSIGFHYHHSIFLSFTISYDVAIVLNDFHRATTNTY